MGPDGARTQEQLCWRGPTEIYWTVLQDLTVEPLPSNDRLRSASMTALSGVMSHVTYGIITDVIYGFTISAFRN
jgi:hypothetical protein